MFLKNEVIAIYIIDLETNEILGANQEAEKLSGYSKDELLQMRAVELADESNDENIRLFVEECKKTGRISFEHIHKKKNGALYLVEITCHILECYGRQLCQSFVRDLSKKKNAGQRIRRLSAQPKNAGLAIFSILDDRIASWNKEAEKMFGYKEAEVIGSSPKIFVPVERRVEFRKIRDIVYAGQSVLDFESERLKKDGTVFCTNQNMFPIKDARGKVIGASLFINNIDKRKKAEKALYAEEQQYRLLVETMNEGIVQVDNEQLILRVNQKFCEMMGYTEEELVGRCSMHFFVDHHDHELQRHRTADRKKGIREKYEIRMQKKSGDWMWAYVSAAPLHNISGKVVGSIGMLIDITQRKRAIEALKEKNKELETFIYKVSHDLKGPLSSALGLTNLTKNIVDSAARAYCQKIETCVGQMESILHNLAQVSVIQQGELKEEKIDFRALVDKIINDLRCMSGFSELVFQKHIKTTGSFRSDPGLLIAIFQNLIQNSIRYRKRNDTPYVQITVEQNCDGVNFSVADNGIGIPKNQHKKIFDMFYRANELSKGSGLGLYIVKNAVEKLKGSIEVKSEVGQGTTFNITSPVQYSML